MIPSTTLISLKNTTYSIKTTEGLRDCLCLVAADGFVVQTGDPEGPAEGFVDPSTEKTRIVPLEIMVVGEKVPFYGETLEVIISLTFYSVFAFFFLTI